MHAVIYRLSPQARKEMLVETGVDPGDRHRLDVDLSTQTPAVRRRWVGLFGVEEVAELPALAVYSSLNDQIEPGYGLAVFDRVYESLPDLLAAYDAVAAAARAAAAAEQARAQANREAEIRKWIGQLQSRLELARDTARPLADRVEAARPPSEAGLKSHKKLAVYGEYTALLADLAALHAELAPLRRAEVEAAESARQAERKAQEAERAAWAGAHGSPRLKKCLAQGYNCQRLYVLERAGAEHPGYVVDFDDKAAWKDRSGPSEAALDEAARVGGVVVWLTAYPMDDGIPDEYQEGWEQEAEAVVIQQYLGKYDLIKMM